MTMLTIGLIVEGQGDQAALPPLIRKMASDAGYFEIQIRQPFRVHRGRFAAKFDDFERAVKFLAVECDCIMTVLDADDDCPKEFAQDLRERAAAIAGHKVVSVVMAKSEFESWILAGIESLRGYRGVLETATCPSSVESIRDAKGTLEAMIESKVYSETVDQVKFAANLDSDLARSNSPSFDKFARDLISILSQAQHQPTD
jgi:hypothetical protein